MKEESHGMCREVRNALSAVKVTDAFWAPRLEINRTVTLPHVFKRCEETGRLSNFDVASGASQVAYQGCAANDSDVFKIVEGAALSLQAHPDPALETFLDGLIDRMVAVQQPNGYLNSFYTAKEPGHKWANLARSHELYCAGHFMEAAVAVEQATGKRKMLEAAVRLADHIDSVFGPGKRIAVPGHQEIELALVKLYRATGEKRYLALSKFFVDQRGNPERLKKEYTKAKVEVEDRGPGRNRPPEYNQDHLPVTEQREAVGHAVRAGYLYAGMTDIAALTGDAAYIKALGAIWQDIAGRKLYLTGSVGTSQYDDEGFGDAYVLPNGTAYCETCAAAAMLLWNHRLCLLHADARYADLAELVLYNGFLPGVSLAGDRFLYRNPLESDGTRQRRAWLEPGCCPSNVVRILPQVPRYVYAVDDTTVYMNLFVGSSAKVEVAGQTVGLTQRTDYPWGGRVELAVEPEREGVFDLAIRIPGWMRGAPVAGDLYGGGPGVSGKVSITVNGKAEDASDLTKGYARIRRTWRRGDTVAIEFPMPVRRVHAHPKVEADRGCAALMRGPLVYCLEAADNAGDVRHAILPPDAVLTAARRPDLLGGVTVIGGRGVGEGGAPVELAAIPYFAWNNRGPGPMVVWIRETR